MPTSPRIAPEVARALAAGEAVVALESTLIAHGLPRGRNLAVARELEDVVRAEGAVPATIAVVSGEVRIGLDDAALEALALGPGFAKAGLRDLAPVIAGGGSAATTVASTSHLAARAGIRVFATGGLGGVHREARESWDESADLEVLARVGIVVVPGCGVLLAWSKAAVYSANPYFWLKLILLSLVIVHAQVFRKSVYYNTEELDRAAEVPSHAKWAAALSLLLWVGVVAAGRMIGYYEPPRT